MEYIDFLRNKAPRVTWHGIQFKADDVHPMLFDWQRDIVLWATRKGRCAVFIDTGMGKTFIQLEWARLLGQKTLIIAPLSVARQTVREAQKIGLTVQYVRSQPEVESDLCITNYEMVREFDMTQFGAVVLDESSILKALDGKTRRLLTETCAEVPYRLCCTATPAPNDHTEIGNHAEFLGVCSQAEMLATFFVNANKEHVLTYGDITYRRKGSNANGTEWRLKHHAEQSFFRWLASWAISMTKPSDLGYDDDGFLLPPLQVHPVFADVDYEGPQLFFTGLGGITGRNQARKQTIGQRIERLIGVVAQHEGQWIVWCGLDTESDALAIAFPEAVVVKGSDSADHKAQSFEAFQNGDYRILITKARIGGWGMNFQNAHNMAFFGLNDSWEAYYQCIRREWRYGQTQPVNVYVVMSDLEQEVFHNIMRKDASAQLLRRGLIESIRNYEKQELEMTNEIDVSYQSRTEHGDAWTAILGDSCEKLPELTDDSIDLSVYSPPFADLFTYSATPRDLGNSRGWQEFFEHYSFIIKEILRVTKPGRLTCVHTSDIPAMAQRDGYIGVRDFPGEVIRAYESCGWVFTGRAFVQKNPQAQAIRVKSKALLFVQLRKDSTDSRPALIDQVLLFRKPGDNLVPVQPVDNGELNNETWIEWAHGIWLGIRETDTLQYSHARAEDDEKHICPLQLGTIERCIKLYSNPGEMVLTPFGGIGSEAYMAVKLGRKATLIELKPEYFEVAVKNLRQAEINKLDLFTMQKTIEEKGL